MADKFKIINHVINRDPANFKKEVVNTLYGKLASRLNELYKEKGKTFFKTEKEQK